MVSIRIDPTSIDLSDHLLREAYGDLARFGFAGPISEETKLRVGKLMLAVVGADGKLSPQERGMLAEFGKAFGVSNARADELLRFDPASVPVERLVTPDIRGGLGCFVYDAIRVARVDGFASQERDAVARVMGKLGLQPALIPALEALLDLEDVVRRNRAELLAAPTDLSRLGGEPLVHDGVGARMMEYSIPPGPVPRGLLVAWGKAVLTVAAADGQLSDPEARWFFGHARAIGAPQDVLEELLKFDPVGASIDDALGRELAPFARTVVFDGVRTARADGVSRRERAVAQRGASLLGLEPSFVLGVEQQLRVEDGLRAARVKLLAPK